MRITTPVGIALVLAVAGCATEAAERPAVEPGRMTRVRNLVKAGMPAPQALDAAVEVLGPPTLVDGATARWMAATTDRCTELRIVAGADTRVQAVALFAVTRVAGAQYQECMAALGRPVVDDDGAPVETCAAPS